VPICRRHLLNKNGSTKQTYQITLDLSDSSISFAVGDSIAIYPENDPFLVDRLMRALQATGEEEIVDKRSGKKMTLQIFLTSSVNLSRLSRPFIQCIHDHETSHAGKSHLYHLLQPAGKELLAEYVATHEPVDLLEEQKQAKPPLQELCNLFAPLLPRFYSVASSYKTDPREVDLMVALARYTHKNEERFGVASHYLIHLAKKNETKVRIYVQKTHDFTIPEDGNKPVIMIGPGTGAAPFRAFLQERIFLGAPGKNWLFFGERNRATDFLYQDFWESLELRGRLKLSLAFSRDQSEKIYVQQKMYEEREALWQWIQEGAILYVCGDKTHMAKDVDTMLQTIAKEVGQISEDQVKIFFKTLKAEKRYLLDVY